MGNFVTGSEFEVSTRKDPDEVRETLYRNAMPSERSDGREVFLGTVDERGFDLVMPRRELRGFSAERAVHLQGRFQDLGPGGGRLSVRVVHTQVYLTMCVVVWVTVIGALAFFGFLRGNPVARLNLCVALLLPLLMQWRFQRDLRRGREALERLLG